MLQSILAEDEQNGEYGYVFLEKDVRKVYEYIFTNIF